MAQRTPVKKVKNGVLYDDGCIRIDNVRFSYPHCGKPTVDTDDDGKPKGKSWSIVGLAPKTSHKAVRDLVNEEIEKLLKEHKTKALPSDKKFLKDGDESGKDENEGMWLISAREKKRPSVRDRRGQPIDVEEIDEQVYGGAWGSILIRPWWQDHKKYGKRANANLLAVQVTKGLNSQGEPLPGAEPFGNGRISESEIDELFEDYGDDEDEGFEDDGDEGDYGGL